MRLEHEKVEVGERGCRLCQLTGWRIDELLESMKE